MRRKVRLSRFYTKARQLQARQRSNAGELRFESLEPRQMLNGQPIALDDLDFFTAINTALTITVSNDGVLANDFDAEGSSLTATKVDNVSHGSLTFNSNGTFTYTPTTGFKGIDQFTDQNHPVAAKRF